MLITGQTFDEERALYGLTGIQADRCRFDGPADGESAFKECRDVVISNTFFNLRYPMWHVTGLKLENSELTDKCRAAIWYTQDASISNTALHGIKALRECARVTIENSDIISPEFGWSVSGITIRNTRAVSEYFMMRSTDLVFENVSFEGKYSFQYIENGTFSNCSFKTKDAFWHAKNVTVKDTTLNGEYLAWYSDGLTLENCTIRGTQPFCYCKNLKLINCRMENCDLAFEKSDVEATVLSHVDSIKNPKSGTISCASYGELIMDDDEAAGKVVLC